MAAEHVGRDFSPQGAQRTGKEEQEGWLIPQTTSKRYLRTAVSTQTILSRLSVFVLALSIASFVLIGKRWDDIEEIWSRISGADPSTSQISKTGVEVGKEYVLCTRSRKGIYTVDDSPDAQAVTQCMVINSDGRIAATGRIDAVLRVYTHLKPRFLPVGAIVVPGLVESHAHLLDYGRSRALDLNGAKNIDEVLARVKEYVLSKADAQGPGVKVAHRHAEEEWIEGVGWDQNLWEGWRGGFPTAADLEADPVLRDRLIILYRTDLHAIWVSRRVIELCGKLPEKVEGGEVVRDSKGKPTGVFLDNAQLLVPIPSWTYNRMKSFYERGIADILSLGVTAFHDALTSEAMIDFFKRMADEDQLPIRLHMMASRDSGYWGKDIQRFENYGKAKRLNLRSVKLLSDGAIGSWGAVMYEPYSDNPSTSGFFVIPLEVLRRDIPRYIDDGWQVNVHCIGDRANGEVLDIFEKEKAARGDEFDRLRPRIEHAQILKANDINRFAEIGVIASVQPTHATSDMAYADARLGSRVKTSYAYKSFINSGARITLGSDAPVESPNPLATFYAAVTRLNSTGTSPQGPGGWYPEEKLTRMEALKGMTLDAAYASFSEDEVGSLVVGKKADFTVLDHDIMSVEPSEILKTKVLATVVDGIVQYGSF